MYLGQIGVIAIAIGILFFCAQVLSVDFMDKSDREKFKIFFAKDKDNRTNDEQHFIDTTWHKYYMTKARNIGFAVGVPLLAGSLLFDYITK